MRTCSVKRPRIDRIYNVQVVIRVQPTPRRGGGVSKERGSHEGENLRDRERGCVKSNMVYTLCKHMVYMLSITNEHKNELEMRAKPEWKVHFLCFASAKRGSFSIR